MYNFLYNKGLTCLQNSCKLSENCQFLEPKSRKTTENNGNGIFFDFAASTPNVELEDDEDSSSRMAPPLGDDFKPFRRLSFPRDSGCFASSENLHRSSPAASDRSFHSGSQTESGIHLTHEDEVRIYLVLFRIKLSSHIRFPHAFTALHCHFL